MTAEKRHAWHAKTADEILDGLQVTLDRGLDSDEVKRRRKRHGSNRLREIKPKSAWKILCDQVKSPIMALLVAAALVSFVFDQRLEGYAIIGVILLTAAIGFVTEIKAVRSMEALREVGRVHTNVRRGGRVRRIAATDLVPGDIVVVEGGDIVTADLRVVEANKLQADESALTGESVPVSKTIDALDEDTPLAERSNMLFKGTAVTRGSGAGVAVATGMNTELGEISELVEKAQDQTTPLEERLNRLGRKLIWVTLGIAGAVGLVGAVRGKELLLMIETAIALAVAAIPEGLPIVATVALARGLLRMAKRNALINRLSSVETLGATSVICTDKTGTLTENKMTVVRMAFAVGDAEVSVEEDGFSRDGKTIDPQRDLFLREALKVGVLCNNASLSRDSAERDGVGDPLEIALLAAGAGAGLRRDSLIAEMPEKREEAFDSEVKMMATFHEQDGEYYVAVKGAPEAVLKASASVLTEDGEARMDDERRGSLEKKTNRMAEEGLRVLALAFRKVSSVDAEPYEDLTFLGLSGLLDPPRRDVADAVRRCREAGIAVVMVTGDQPVTARYIAGKVGLIDQADIDVVQGSDLEDIAGMSRDEKKRMLSARVFARVDPRQKLNLISLHQDNGSIVGMTGDGVNDAPALKKADIGIAMGKRGTQVAKEASDMILQDDSFPTIVSAVRHGRVIFGNIRKFVLFLLSGNVGEILSVGLATSANLPLPLLPLQILFINLILDVFPALALGVGEGGRTVMNRPPRDPREPVLTRRHWWLISGYGTVIAAAVLGVLAAALFWFDMPRRQAVTISFLTLGFARLWHVFNMRDRGMSLFRNEITRNGFVWGALALCAALLAATVFVPPLAGILDVVNPGSWGWVLILGASLVPLAAGQIYRAVSGDSSRAE